jgi:hypothetical protein
VQLYETLVTAQAEIRAEGVVVAVLPFGLLALICARNEQFRSFYSSGGGLLVIAAALAMGAAGWKIIDRLGKLPSEQRVIGVTR